jgi:hypothetical protein
MEFWFYDSIIIAFPEIETDGGEPVEDYLMEMANGHSLRLFSLFQFICVLIVAWGNTGRHEIKRSVIPVRAVQIDVLHLYDLLPFVFFHEMNINSTIGFTKIYVLLWFVNFWFITMKNHKLNVKYEHNIFSYIFCEIFKTQMNELYYCAHKYKTELHLNYYLSDFLEKVITTSISAYIDKLHLLVFTLIDWLHIFSFTDKVVKAKLRPTFSFI